MDSNNPENRNIIAGAITYPGGSDDHAQPMTVQPRQPRNLQGLLRFAMEATKAEDAPGNSQLGPMDEQRRKFLEDALKSLTIDVARVLQESICVLTNSAMIWTIRLGEPLPDEVRTSFNNLLEYVDDIDVANDFYKMGGFAIFPICYSCENEEVRTFASSVLAELCQNNPFCQARALDSGLLNVLVNLAQVEKGQTLNKCLGAISCICRDFERACLSLLEQGGCGVLFAVVRERERATRTKAVFFIRHLCQHFNEAKEQFIQLNLVGTLAELLKAERDETTEHILGTLSAMIEGLNPTVLQQCRDPSKDLKKTLKDLLKHPDLEGDTFEEEKVYCRDILREVFENWSEPEVLNGDGADR